MQKAAAFARELLVAAFNDSLDEADAFVSSLAERLSSDEANADALREREEKIREKIKQIKKICSDWRCENPNVEICKLYFPKEGERLEGRGEERVCQALEAERLETLKTPTDESCVVGLTLIPGIYSQTKWSRANLAPAYVVAQPKTSPEVEQDDADFPGFYS